MRSLELKIKLKTLAAEAKFIRREELRLKGNMKRDAYREHLYLHRINVVRREARATHLAYQFLRGIPYEQVENHALPLVRPPRWDRVLTMVQKYGDKPLTLDDLKAWREKTAKAA